MKIALGIIILAFFITINDNLTYPNRMTQTKIDYDTEKDLYELLKKVNPNVRILGSDYEGKPFTGDDLPPKIVYTTRSHGWSTTKLKDLITKQTIKQNPNIMDEINLD